LQGLQGVVIVFSAANGADFHLDGRWDGFCPQTFELLEISSRSVLRFSEEPSFPNDKKRKTGKQQQQQHLKKGTIHQVAFNLVLTLGLLKDRPGYYDLSKHKAKGN